MLKVATVSPNEPYREYKDVERVYSGSTEIDKILDKNGNVLFAVNKEVEGTPPLTYKGKEETNLKNYRIYGQTIDGESVGDRTGNLFDGSFIHRSVIVEEVSDYELYRRSIVVDISNFNNGDKITFSRETSAGSAFQMYQVNSPLKGGRLCKSDNVFTGDSNTLLATITLDDIANYHYLMIFLNGATKPITDEELLASKIMVNVGNTPLPYEPYGYKVPVTVSDGTDTLTTPIYLPEQIKMVGDEAEYIDYAEQKQHRVRKNLVSDYNVNATKTRYDPVLHCFADLMPNTNYIITFLMDSQTDFYTNEYVFEPTRYTNKLPGNKKLIVKTKETLNKNDIRQYRSAYGWIILKSNSEQTENPNISYVQIRLASIEDDTYEPYIENTDLDVTLPALPVLSGTNTLTVGTEVQPSNVYLKGRIKEVS